MIDVKNLTFRYKGSSTDTIRGISFAIGRGEIYGFLGPSGAGKSTTQHILTRLIKGYHGSVTVMNQPLHDFTNSYYNHIGVGFELPNHYTRLTGFENLKLFASLYDKPTLDLMTLMDRVGLKESAHKKTDAYSKGMKMRLNFIRAIMHDPEILFLDEPTSGLDPVNAENIKSMILELKAQGKTIFLTTHNMHDADELCDRVAFMANGNIVIEDTPRNLKTRFGEPSITIEYLNDRPLSETFPLENLGHNHSFLELIRQYPVISIHTREASLNEVFIKTTGCQLSLPE